MSFHADKTYSVEQLQLVKNEFLDAIADRKILNITAIAVVNGMLYGENGFIAINETVSCNGSISMEDDHVGTLYKGSENSYQAIFKLPTALPSSNGLTVKFKLSDWETIRYLAIGHTAEEGFRHVKIPNPSTDEWVTFSVGYNDLIFGIKNNWKNPAAGDVRDVRLYIKGTPKTAGARIDAGWIAVWYEDVDDQPDWLRHSQSEPFITSEDGGKLFLAIRKYFIKSNPKIGNQVRKFFSTGECPITDKKALHWPIDKRQPDSLFDSGTYRYMWHAMQPAISMMVFAQETDSPSLLFSARDFISAWLENSFFTPDPDTKFTWYDHGTAERLMSLLYMYSIGHQFEFDYRFMSRLRLVIFRHAQLLESEAFYASYQPVRYHNHAWFQDMALIATTVALPSFPCSVRWQNRAITRLLDQFNHLIARDQGFAVFIENSIGYHHGVQRLVEFGGELIQLSGRDSEIPFIAQELNAWSRYLRYPDGRSPSQGDTFRRPNSIEPGKQADKPYAKGECTILSKAGYAVVKGNHDDRPFMLAFFATSLCETHKHADNLSFTLYFDGVEWMIDPSYYSHDYADTIPSYLRSSSAHNNVELPGKTYRLHPGLATLNGKSEQDTFEINGSHNAYADFSVNRYITGSTSCLVIYGNDHVDSVVPGSNVDARLNFHFGEGVSPRVMDNSIQLTHPRSNYRIEVVFLSNNGQIGTPVSIDESFAGSGFMQTEKTFVANYNFSTDCSVQWKIKAKKIVVPDQTPAEVF